MNVYKDRRKCPLCDEIKCLDAHHLFSQSNLHIKLYGSLIHHPKNIVYICRDCHLTKPLPKMTEREFCKKLNISTRSKTGLL